ncbi:MAG: hypothetical protein Q7U16_14280 [Agitococcus sp.]|nr:hypothetical protein [Agitococcus sp.]
MLQERTEELCAWLTPKVHEQAWQEEMAWPGAPSADVVSLDLAVVTSDHHPSGWDLCWVEYQTFTSIAAAIHVLALASQDIWPELCNLRQDTAAVLNPQWLSEYRKWVAPCTSSIILEYAPHQQSTYFDLAANAHLLGVPLVEPRDLVLRPEGLYARTSQGSTVSPVNHIFNRLILSDDPNALQTQALLAHAPVSWHSHPAWFYRVHKGLLAEMPLPPGQRCASAEAWRSLGHAAEQLVLKAKFSFGGKAVKLHVTSQELDELAHPQDWMVQPRYQSASLFTASDGVPIFGEFRCIVQLCPKGHAVTLARFARLFRGSMASSKSWVGAPGEGLAVLYGPPD